MPAIGGTQGYTLSLRDVSCEVTSHKIFIGEITAVNLAGVLADFGSYRGAVDNLTLGVIAADKWGEETTYNNDCSTFPQAHRENKLLVAYRGRTTQKPYTLTIGTVDFTAIKFLTGAGDEIAIRFQDDATQQILDYVQIFEQLARAPDNENENVDIVSIRYVGRNT